MFVLHWSQYTCGRFALRRSRHAAQGVTKLYALELQSLAPRRRHLALGHRHERGGPSGVAASPSSAQRCSGTANSGATDADSG